MTKILVTFFMLLVLIVIGGGVFLAAWDIPAPSSNVERILDDKRFPQ